jgi:pilus assembly protein Flp/PilA
MLALQRFSWRGPSGAKAILLINHAAQAFGRRRGRRLLAEPEVSATRVNQGARMSRLRAILRCEKGANAIEYALVAALITIAAVAAFDNLGNKIDGMYNNVENHM